jgi:hypothetical protein
VVVFEHYQLVRELEPFASVGDQQDRPVTRCGENILDQRLGRRSIEM